MTDPLPGLSVQNLSWRFGTKLALVDVSFRVDIGRFCALLGPNGAGKSTLFSLMTGLLAAPEGKIRTGDCDLKHDRRKALSKIGVVFQQPTLDLDLTVQQNLRYFSALHGQSKGHADRRIATVLARLDMAERAAERVRNLNGGHRRRMEIARALIHEPTILLLDEPTVGLDAATRTSITSHVHDLAHDTGLTVLWATHLTDEVQPNDRLVILHQGRIIEDGVARDIAGSKPLSAKFLTLTAEPA